MTDDLFDTPEWRRYAKHARKKLEPMVQDSAFCMSLYDGHIDPKMALETGYMILLDKPIIAIVTPGSKVPRKLVAVADEIVEGTMGDPDFEERMKAAIDRVTAKIRKGQQ